MNPSRRSVVSALGVALPFGLGATLVAAAPASVGAPSALRFRPFEEAVRQAFTGRGQSPLNVSALESDPLPCRRIEIGHSDQVRAGVQGCHNHQPFAGFSAGSLKIVRTGSEPGPIRHGVRLYIAYVDVVLSREAPTSSSRPLNFASLPPAPLLS